MARKIFVNLPVKDLQRSIAFFSGLGFTFNPQFTDETATCMIVSDDAYVMLLTEPKFLNFTKKRISDTANASEAIIAVNGESRANVDEFADKALATGGSPAMPPMDLGFMYGRSFYDPDGHHWEIFYMDPET
ncbi:MAG: VOC family protein [Hyphomicrobium sp.]|nr:VOC family protein [Hyphomicrobium sp.]